MLQIAEQFHREEQPLHQRQASLRAIAYDAGVSLNDRQVKWLDKQGERAAHNLKDGYTRVNPPASRSQSGCGKKSSFLAASIS